MAKQEPIRKILLQDGKTVRYRLVVDVGRDPATGKRKQFTGTYEKRRDAQNELSRIRHQRATGTFVQPSKATLNTFLDEWLAGRRKLEAGTLSNYRNALKPARERLGKRELQSLRKPDMDALVDWMSTAGRKRGGEVGTGVSARSIQLTLSVLQQALDVAVADQRLPYNPVRITERPKQTKTKRTPWTVAEVKAFLDAIHEDRLYVVMLLSLMGLRPEEVCGLKWDRVDFEAGTITIDWARTLVDGEMIEKSPKTAAGERALPLPRAATGALKSFKVKQAAEKLAAGEAYEASGFVVVDELGHALKTDQLRRRFYKLVDTAGARAWMTEPKEGSIGKRVTPYASRHSCLTYLATNGVPDVVVSAWAGHSDLSFTKRTYIHPSAENLIVGRDKLDELFG